MTRDPYSAKVELLREAALSGPGTLPAGLRHAAAAGGDGLPAPFDGYVGKVARHAYEITDADVEGLREAGFSEDQIFEATVAAAVGAGLLRLEAGLATLR